jgi:hypothetical protein
VPQFDMGRPIRSLHLTGVCTRVRATHHVHVHACIHNPDLMANAIQEEAIIAFLESRMVSYRTSICVLRARELLCVQSECGGQEGGTVATLVSTWLGIAPRALSKLVEFELHAHSQLSDAAGRVSHSTPFESSLASYVHRASCRALWTCASYASEDVLGKLFDAYHGSVLSPMSFLACENMLSDVFSSTLQRAAGGCVASLCEKLYEHQLTIDSLEVKAMPTSKVPPFVCTDRDTRTVDRIACESLQTEPSKSISRDCFLRFFRPRRQHLWPIFAAHSRLRQVILAQYILMLQQVEGQGCEPEDEDNAYHSSWSAYDCTQSSPRSVTSDLARTFVQPPHHQ